MKEQIKIEKVYYIEGVEVPTIEDWLRLKKMDATFKESDLESCFLKYSYVDNEKIINPDSTPMETVLKLWNELEPYTIEEIKTKFGINSEIYNLAMNLINKTDMEKLTLEILKNYEGSEYEIIEYAKTFYNGIYPERPKKPLLNTKHSASDVAIYADKLKTYEKEMELYNLEYEKARKTEAEVIEIIEEFIKDASGLNNTVPEKYRDKVYSRAYSEGHSAGYYEVYNNLRELVNIFE